MKLYLISMLVAFILCLILGVIIVPLLKRIKAGQPILKYVEAHKQKSGTPTMGGLFFVVSASLVFFIFNGFNLGLASISVVITTAYMIVGFLDDFLKIRLKDNQGLKVYQKILFQLSIAVISAFYVYNNGLTSFYLPFSKQTFDFGIWTIPLVIFIFLAITNSVNLTDGLDGLASSVSVVYLIFLFVLVYLQDLLFPTNLNAVEYQSILCLITCFIGALLGFLIFNVNKAKVFMGDTGSLALGGLIGCVSIFSRNSLFIPILGFTFVGSA
ncbi:MAG: phospho-N-acetylmuramoyl-pentapeptide-transferase, partial [Clostridia bacterium]|nr:phospho-N-acetylmuramoyl-pentapeptide-transferase [Clostridia bacterium]